MDSSANGGGATEASRAKRRARRARTRERARVGRGGGVENRVSRIALDRAPGPALGFSRGRSRARAGTIGCFDAMEGGDGRWTRDETKTDGSNRASFERTVDRWRRSRKSTRSSKPCFTSRRGTF